jgi:hypothetical protein
MNSFASVSRPCVNGSGGTIFGSWPFPWTSATPPSPRAPSGRIEPSVP